MLRWKEHPWPGRDDPDDESQIFYRVLLQHQDELLKAAPNDSLLLMMRFTALGEIDGITGEQLTAAADKLLNALPKDPIWQASPPVNFQIVRAFVKKKVNLDRVPGLVEEGLTLEHEHEWRSDGETEETKASRKRGELQLRTQAAELLAGAAKELKNPEIARAAVTELDTFTPDTAEGSRAFFVIVRHVIDPSA